MKKQFLSQENDSMAFIRGNDLKELISYVQSIILEYRATLDLPNFVTIGLELEYENLAKKVVDEYVGNNFKKWRSSTDGTVMSNEDMSGGEIISPILYDNVITWFELEKICQFLQKNKATASECAGGHVHIGTNILDTDIENWLTFLKIYVVYEHVLFRFFYGDKLNGRSLIDKYAPPIADDLSILIKDGHTTLLLRDLKEQFRKYGAINFRTIKVNADGKINDGETIEFRTPNGTIFQVIEQNNINTITKLLLAARNKQVDVDFLDYKLKNEFYGYKKYSHLYNEVCLKDALEFVDLVFNHNIDKVYFLRQYLKDFSNNYKLSSVTEAKVFYRK